MRLLLVLVGCVLLLGCSTAEPRPPWNGTLDTRSPDLLRPDMALPGEDTSLPPDGPRPPDGTRPKDVFVPPKDTLPKDTLPKDMALPPSFNDVPPSHVHHTEIMWVAQKGYMYGCQPSLFCPANQVLRSEMASAVGRMKFGTSFTPNPTPHFSDVPASHPAFKHVQRLVDHGSLAGCAAGLFCPNAGATRAAIAVLMIKTKFGDSFGYSTMPHFSDVPAGHPAFKYIQKMKDELISEGCGGGKYCPDDFIQRQQLAVFLYKAKTL
jgi:hypothetical protein